MKKFILILLATLSAIGFFQAGILKSLFMFVIMGAIPGTKIILSPDTMAAIIGVIFGLVVLTILSGLLPRVASLYRRSTIRKQLLAIPAFRHQVRTHQA